MALVVSRKKGASLWIGPIRLTLVDCEGGQGLISIEAPREFEVLREELAPERPAIEGKFRFAVPRDQVETALAKWAEAQKEKVAQ